MPISREDYQARILDDQDNSVEEFADTLEGDKVTGSVEPAARVSEDTVESAIDFKDNSNLSNAGNVSAEKGSPETHAKSSLNLPPADTTSAEKKEAVGATHPQRETHRSAATGRDVPQFTRKSEQREKMEFNWDEVRAQTEVFERRARMQKDAATEHLARIHDIVGLLIEVSAAHSYDGERKLQSLESKVAELETRIAVNRSSQ